MKTASSKLAQYPNQGVEIKTEESDVCHSAGPASRVVKPTVIVHQELHKSASRPVTKITTFFVLERLFNF